jgi:hypothetical protein
METQGQTRESVRQEATETAEHARTATRDIAETAKGQAQQVTREAGEQARRVVDDARERLGGELDSQTGRAASGLRQWADELDRMAEAGADGSPVRRAVRQLSDGGRQAADYLDEQGVGGVVEKVGTFARRRPGTFLIGAAVSGFLAGRLAKATVSAGSGERHESASGAGEGALGGAPSGEVPSAATETDSAPVSGVAGVPSATGSYGATPYENGGQAIPPAGPSGQVR